MDEPRPEDVDEPRPEDVDEPRPEDVDEPWPELPADLAGLSSYDLPTPVVWFAVSLPDPARARFMEGLRRLPSPQRVPAGSRREMQAALSLEVEKFVLGMQDDPSVIRCALAIAVTLGPSGRHYDDWFGPVAFGLRGPRVFEGLKLDDLLALPAENLEVAECAFSGVLRAGRRDLADALLARSGKTRRYILGRLETGWLSEVFPGDEYLAGLRRQLDLERERQYQEWRRRHGFA